MIFDQFTPEQIKDAVGIIELRALVNYKYREAVQPMLDELIKELRK